MTSAHKASQLVWYQRSQTLVLFFMMLLRTAEALLSPPPMQGIPSLPHVVCPLLSNGSLSFPTPSSLFISRYNLSLALPAPPKSQLNGVCHMEVGKNWCGLTSHRVCVCARMYMRELLSHSGHEFTFPHPRRGQLPPGFAKMLLFPRNLKYSKGTVTLWFATSPDHNIYLAK